MFRNRTSINYLKATSSCHIQFLYFSTLNEHGCYNNRGIAYEKINLILILYVRSYVTMVSSYVLLVFTGLSSNTQFEVNLLLQLFLAFGRLCGVALRQNWQLLQDFGKDYFLSERHLKEFFAFKMQTIFYWHVYCNQYYWENMQNNAVRIYAVCIFVAFVTNTKLELLVFGVSILRTNFSNLFIEYFSLYSTKERTLINTSYFACWYSMNVVVCVSSHHMISVVKCKC